MRLWPRLRIAGTDVSVHPASALLLALAAAAGLAREAAVLGLVLAGHEAAHIAAARAFRLRVEELLLLPFGAALRLGGLELADPGVEATVALAGPLHNLLWLAGGFTLREAGWLAPHTGSFFLFANAVIGGGNLLPALPLDGGRALRAALALRIGQAAATRALARSGVALGVALLAAAGAALVAGLAVPGLFVFGGFVLLSVGRERRAGGLGPWIAFAGRARRLGAAGCLPLLPLAVGPNLPLRHLVRRFQPHAYHLVWVVDPSGEARGPWDEAAILDALRSGGAAATASDLRVSSG